MPRKPEPCRRELSPSVRKQASATISVGHLRSRSMSLSDLANLGSFVSSIAVLISLIYLAQIERDNATPA